MTDAIINATRIRAVGLVYTAATFDEARLFPVVDRIVSGCARFLGREPDSSKTASDVEPILGSTPSGTNL